jgi:hypothetical protein
MLETDITMFVASSPESGEGAHVLAVGFGWILLRHLRASNVQLRLAKSTTGACPSSFSASELVDQTRAPKFRLSLGGV